MQVNQMPNCCGVMLVLNFGYTTTNGMNRSAEYKPTNEEIVSYLKQFLNQNKAFVIYINEEQRKNINKALLELKFKRTFSFKHLAHNTIIHQYTFIKDELKLKQVDLPKIKKPSL